MKRDYLIVVCLMSLLGAICLFILEFSIDNKVESSSLEGVQFVASKEESVSHQEHYLLNPESFSSCKSYLIKPKDVLIWKRNKYQIIKEEFNSIPLVLGNVLARDFLFKELGISLYRGKMLAGVASFNKKLPKFYNGTSTLSSVLEQRIVDTILKTSGTPIKDIADSINSGVIKTNQFYPLKDGLDFLFTYIIKTIPSLSESKIIMLLNTDIPIEKSDLYYAMSLEVSDRILDIMLQNANFDIYEPIEYAGYRTSFAFKAIKAGKFKIAFSLIRNKADATLNGLQPNAFDILASLKPTMINDNTIRLVEKLNKLKVIPTKKDSHKKLVKLFDQKKVFLPKNYMLVQHEIDPHTFKFVRDFKIKIFTFLLKNSVSISSENISNHHCFNTLGAALMKLVTKPKAKLPTTKEIETPALTSKKELSYKQSIILDAMSQSTNPWSVESILSEHGGILGKRLVNGYREKLQEQKIEEFNDLVKQQAEYQEAKQTQLDMLQVLQLAQSGQWEEALELLKTYGLAQKDLYSTLLILAINLNAKLEVIKELVENGATIAENSILLLIKNNNIEAMKYLLNYGLELNFRNALGYSALMLTIKYNRYSAFNFLLKHGVHVNNPDNYFGYDALDIALLSYNKSIGLIYINKLIDYGADIDLSHKEIVNSMKSGQFDDYMVIIAHHPYLKVGT